LDPNERDERAGSNRWCVIVSWHQTEQDVSQIPRISTILSPNYSSKSDMFRHRLDMRSSCWPIQLSLIGSIWEGLAATDVVSWH
jgi:hypothetical protein